MAKNDKKKAEGDEKPTYREVYLYHRNTGAYVGPVDATEKDPDGPFTEIKPPVFSAMDEVAIFKNGTWTRIKHSDLELMGQHVTKRDRLLAGSDFSQLADSQVDKKVWAEYRQKLRDITKGEGFPAVCVFPELPSYEVVAPAPAEPVK